MKILKSVEEQKNVRETQNVENKEYYPSQPNQDED